MLTAAFWNTNVRDNSNELAPFFAAWTAYTPSVANLTLGNGTLEGAYLKVGRLVVARAKLTLGSTTTIGNTPALSLPITPSGFLLYTQGTLHDISTGDVYPANLEYSQSTYFAFQAINTAGTFAKNAILGATNVFTWATGDIMFAGAIYMSST